MDPPAAVASVLPVFVWIVNTVCTCLLVECSEFSRAVLVKIVPNEAD